MKRSGTKVDSTALLAGPSCIRCGTTKAERWTVCFATDGTKHTFCYKCHREGYAGGFSYLGDPVYTANAHPHAEERSDDSVQAEVR